MFFSTEVALVAALDAVVVLHVEEGLVFGAGDALGDPGLIEWLL